MQSGAPSAAAGLLGRALAEPPAPARRLAVLREAGAAEASAGRGTACVRLEEALSLGSDPVERAQIALEVAEGYAALFRWVDAVDVIERALAELGDTDGALAARLEGELVVCGLHDARRASRVAPVLARLSSGSPLGSPAEASAVALVAAAVLRGLVVPMRSGVLADLSAQLSHLRRLSSRVRRLPTSACTLAEAGEAE